MTLYSDINLGTTGSTVANTNTIAGHSHTLSGTNGMQVATIGAIKELDDRLVAMEKMMLMIKADEVLIEKYPALKEAYDHYQMILKLTNLPSEK